MNTLNQPAMNDVASTRKLRVALLGYRSNPFSGGQGVYIRSVALGMADRGHRIDVISGEPYPDLPAHPNIKLIKLPGLNLYASGKPDTRFRLRYFRSLTNSIEWLSIVTGGFPEPFTFGQRVLQYLSGNRHNYDIIHDNQTLSWGVLALQKRGFTLTTTVHHPITFDRDIALMHAKHMGMRLLIRRWHYFLRMQKRVVKQLDHLITVSQNSLEDIAASFAVPRDRISVISNGIDTRTFRPLPDIQRDPHLLISTASADQPLKGTQYLIPAFAQLQKKHPDLRLLIIGHPKKGGTTEALIAEYKLELHVTFIHGITTKELVSWYAQSTIAIVPSEYEGFGLPAAEAMACGVAVVSSDGGALPEVVGNAGVVIPAKSVRALVEATDELLRNPIKRDELATLGVKRVREQFSTQHVASALEAHYLGLLKVES